MDGDRLPPGQSAVEKEFDSACLSVCGPCMSSDAFNRLVDMAGPADEVLEVVGDAG